MKICTNQLLESLSEKVLSYFIHNIWSAKLADIELISEFNKGRRFLLCVIDICSKYAWVVLLKYKKVVTINNTSYQF